jgi:hypothetical protein
MPALLDSPVLFGPLVILLLVAAGWAGGWLRSRQTLASAEAPTSFKTLEGAVLGLLSLLLGFSFAMAVGRYDHRKQLELDEANAIGTSWLRTSNLDEPERTRSREVLRDYVPVRLGFFAAGTHRQAVAASLDRTAALQNELWKLATDPSNGSPNVYKSLYVASLNDCFDLSEKRTAAAFEDRIPRAVWFLLLFISFTASVLVGVSLSMRSPALLLVVPLVMGATLTLILDMDSPRSGFVTVYQSSMQRVADQIAHAPR